VFYFPSALGTENETLTVLSNAGSQDIALTGTSSAACLSIAPGSFDFGMLPENALTGLWCGLRPQVFAVSNLCATPVTLVGAAIDHAFEAAPQFALTSDTPAFPLVLEPGAELDLSAAFEPTLQGDVSATIEVTTSEFNPPSPYQVSLTGEAAPPGMRTDTSTATGSLRFPLTQTPAGALVAVSVDGLSIPQAGNWTYDAASNAVIFVAGSAEAPVAGDTVALSYSIAC